jgi:hypothetical protein
LESAGRGKRRVWTMSGGRKVELNQVGWGLRDKEQRRFGTERSVVQADVFMPTPKPVSA